MFASFNFSEFAAIFAVYAVMVVISQIFLPQIAGLIFKLVLRNVNYGLMIVAGSFAVWIIAMVIFGLEAIAVFAIGVVVEATLSHFRRKKILAAIAKNFEDPTIPLNFNDINSKAL